MNHLKLIVFILGFLMITACATKHANSPKFDLDTIERKGKITVLIDNSALSYFEWRGKNMGFEFEILDSFAKSLGLKLEVKVMQNQKDFLTSINNGEGDVIACNQAVTLSAKKNMDFSIPFYSTHQVLIQRKNNDSILIKEPSKLANKKIYVVKGTAYELKLQQLSDELGEKIDCRFLETAPNTEDLIEMVAAGKINYTIANENLGRISQELHENLNTQTIISATQNIAFGLRKNNPKLKQRLDRFLSVYCKSMQFSELKLRYFDYMKVSPVIEITPLKKGNISPFDNFFIAAAKKYGWDWKILAAISCKESNFNPNARGLGGAFGLMQFMPRTGASYGVNPSSTPEEQINAAMTMINKVYLSWASIPDTEQRLKFMLASYNAGRGHIDDAKRLAIKYGLNPQIWDENVQVMVKNLADPTYYRDPLVKCGAYRGPASSYATKVYQKYLSWK